VKTGFGQEKKKIQHSLFNINGSIIDNKILLVFLLKSQIFKVIIVGY